jgi:hypothetical protein
MIYSMDTGSQLNMCQLMGMNCAGKWIIYQLVEREIQSPYYF